MGGRLPSPSATEWSINTSKTSLNSLSDHSPSSDDHDFLDKVLFLNPAEERAKSPGRANDSSTNVSTKSNRDADQSMPDPHDHKISANGVLSNAVLPTNALCLHLNDPSAPISTYHDPLLPPPNAAIAQFRPTRVRFRSRVRITSGISRHRRRGSIEPSTGSSRSSSPSSSISAPLRYHSDTTTSNPWGTLGQRVGLLALQKKVIGSPNSSRRNRRSRPIMSEQTTERTPLRGSFPSYDPYTSGDTLQDQELSEDDDKLSREVDGMFGTFPGRLLDRHWWYWQVEPILCCHYAADFE